MIICGAIIGAVALTLGEAGNPANMGVCVACFLRDSAGSFNLHSASAVQYFRPEITGFVIGAFASALLFREFSAKGGSAPVIRFTLGFFMMLGCLVFLGCPLRMMLRLGAGDLNALIGLAGLVAGIGVGCLFIKKGFTLPRNYRQSSLEGALFPIICLALLLLFLWNGELFRASVKGPGASHAPVWLSLIGGVLIGIVVQRSRFCFIGMAKNIFLTRNFSMALGVLALTLLVGIGNLYLGKFTAGFEHQPIAHADGVWNFLSMALVGLCGVFITGCPLRQLVRAGQGSSDAAIVVLGMLLGAAAAHNFSLASSPAGPTAGGKIIVIIGILLTLIIGVIYIFRARKIVASAGKPADE
ncbi:YedE family putative selenium transporter [Mixta tenebrionis]|nr:YedE family putative selenium transporter [Mixta tenebrionis]